MTFLPPSSIITYCIICMLNSIFCFESEEKVRGLLHNVSFLLKLGGYLIGIILDSSTIWQAIMFLGHHFLAFILNNWIALQGKVSEKC
uniref:mRNA (guanine-N(7))-methyltransferase n=1 Tax=Lactuca sativa TaxID=4236 RepID=A0A9R1VVC9_LACSA|nr:hypothetical protein LSAT_V11C400197130 [Lactuca sativa]